jgi:tRNA-binding protein
MEENLISWQDFEKVAIHVGTIIAVNDFSEAKKPAYQLQIDFGKNIGTKKSSAQITELYTKESLIGKQILAVINFPKKQIASFMSECLVLGLEGKDKEVSLVTSDFKVINGTKLT